MSIYSRRSIRKYKSKEVSKELLDKILDAGRVSPSAKNRQPWKYIVFGGEKKEELLDVMERGIQREEKEMAMFPDSKDGIPDAKNTLRIMREAPIIIVVENTNGSNPFDEIDADRRITEICDTLSIGASIENILLKAEELGLGTLWIANTCYAYPELVTYLNIKGQLIGTIAVGYADEKPAARPRKKLEDIVEYK